MGKQSLTAGDIKDIEKYLEQQKEACDDIEKAKINELIKKPDEMEIKK